MFNGRIAVKNYDALFVVVIYVKIKLYVRLVKAGKVKI